MRYLRIYADDAGESHLEDVHAEVQPTAATWSAVAVEHSVPFDVRTAFFRHLHGDDTSGEPHNSPRRQLIVSLDGACEVRTSDGDVRRLGPGTVALVEDLTGVGHWTRLVGDGTEPGEGEATVLVVTLADDAAGPGA